MYNGLWVGELHLTPCTILRTRSLALALALALALLFALVLALALALVLALSWCGRAGGREDAFGTPWLPCPASGVSQTLSQALSHACHMPVTCLLDADHMTIA